MLHAPISNSGIKGFYRTAAELTRWPSVFNEKYLKLALFNIYIFIEVGGTGGGCFRYMYSRFLKEAAAITSNHLLTDASEMIFESGRLFTETAHLFINADQINDAGLLIKEAVLKLKKIAVTEEKAFGLLQTIK